MLFKMLHFQDRTVVWGLYSNLFFIRVCDNLYTRKVYLMPEYALKGSQNFSKVKLRQNLWVGHYNCVYIHGQ